MKKNGQKNPHCLYSEKHNSLERIYLTQIATKMRDFADEDYIASRSMYRQKQYRNFVYLCVQSCEKYLKSILLFIEKEAPKTHDLVKLYNQIKAHSKIKISKKSLDFLKNINNLDTVVRYANAPYHWDYEWLHELDCFVRDIRPYCVTRFVFPPIYKKGLKLAEKHININAGLEKENKYLIRDGFLEKLVLSKLKPQKLNVQFKDMRSNLIWNNMHFGKNRKKKIWVTRGFSSSSIHPISQGSPHARKYFEYLSKFFHYHIDVKNYFKNLKP